MFTRGANAVLNAIAYSLKTQEAYSHGPLAPITFSVLKLCDKELGIQLEYLNYYNQH